MILVVLKDLLIITLYSENTTRRCSANDEIYTHHEVSYHKILFCYYVELQTSKYILFRDQIK